MPTLHSYEDFDPEKSTTLLKFLARASKRIHEKEAARKAVEVHLAQLKKVSTKNIRRELDILGQKIADALAKEAKIKSRQEQEEAFHGQLREKIEALEKKLAVYLEQSEARAKRIRELEEQIREKHLSRGERAEMLANKIAQLERIYNELRKEKVGKKRLAAVRKKIDALKKRLKDI